MMSLLKDEETAAVMRNCIRCGKPIKGARGSGLRESFCRKHAAEYQRHWRAGTVDEWRLGNQFTERKNAYYYETRVQDALHEYAISGHKTQTAQEAADAIGCSRSAWKVWLKRYCEENNLPRPLYAGCRIAADRTNRHKPKNQRKLKRKHLKGRDEADVLPVLLQVVRGEILTVDAAERFDVSRRSIARWIRDLGVVEKAGMDARKDKEQIADLTQEKVDRLKLQSA